MSKNSPLNRKHLPKYFLSNKIVKTVKLDKSEIAINAMPKFTKSTAKTITREPALKTATRRYHQITIKLVMQ